MKKKSLLLSIFALILLLILSSGCSTVRKPLPANSKLIVYTTIYPVYDFTKKIGGERVEVINVIPLSAQSHSFEPSTKMVAELSRAKLLIYNGAGMENFIPKLSQTLQGSGVKLVDTSKGLSLLKNEEEENEEEEHEEGETENGEYDPHIWLSPTRAAQQSQAIYQALAELDPSNAAYYLANLQSFQQELKLLDQEYRSVISNSLQKNLIISHAAFAYLANDYGLRQIPLMGVNAEAEPGPATLKEVIQFFEQNKLRYVFWDPLDSPKLVQTLTDATGAIVLPLDSLGAMNEKELQAGQDYLSVMRTNLANLKKGLGDQHE